MTNPTNGKWAAWLAQTACSGYPVRRIECLTPERARSVANKLNVRHNATESGFTVFARANFVYAVNEELVESCPDWSVV